jgi:hypothetical protein
VAAVAAAAAVVVVVAVAVVAVVAVVVAEVVAAVAVAVAATELTADKSPWTSVGWPGKGSSLAAEVAAARPVRDPQAAWSCQKVE